MARKVKIKLKQGKAKIKLKSGDENLPLNNHDLTKLLGVTLASAVASPLTPAISGLLADPQKGPGK